MKAQISDLIGKVLTLIARQKDQSDDESLLFECQDGTKYLMYHGQDCCESVIIEDINGDLNDLVGTPILAAAESVSTNEDYNESSTWTFYNFATIKGYVTIRWYGSSNGYYSESVDFIQL